MVEQSHAKLARRFGARVDFDAYESVFQQRREAAKLIVPRGIEAAFTASPSTYQEQSIVRLIREWHTKQITVREAELQKQRERLAEAEAKLRQRETKKALNDQRIASSKIPWLEARIHWHKLTRATDEDARVFPQHYLSMVYTDDDGNRVVGPFRYHLRPAWASEKWDFQRAGSYNARRDSLKKVWKNQFGSQHGLLLVKRFWENVAANKYSAKPKLPSELSEQENIVIMFEPDDGEWMLVPTIYDVWRRKGKPPLFSTALITDDPLEEVALAGHDRTLISLNETSALQWLDVSSCGTDMLFELLDDIKRPYYGHAIAA